MWFKVLPRNLYYSPGIWSQSSELRSLNQNLLNPPPVFKFLPKNIYFLPRILLFSLNSRFLHGKMNSSPRIYWKIQEQTFCSAEVDIPRSTVSELVGSCDKKRFTFLHQLGSTERSPHRCQHCLGPDHDPHSGPKCLTLEITKHYNASQFFHNWRPWVRRRSSIPVKHTVCPLTGPNSHLGIALRSRTTWLSNLVPQPLPSLEQPHKVICLILWVTLTTNSTYVMNHYQKKYKKVILDCIYIVNFSNLLFVLTMCISEKLIGCAKKKGKT